MNTSMNRDEFISILVNRAALIATRAAMNGHPLESVYWAGPATGSQDMFGTFAIKYWDPAPASIQPPWKNI